jgi:hypothetical protein
MSSAQATEPGCTRQRAFYREKNLNLLPTHKHIVEINNQSPALSFRHGLTAQKRTVPAKIG